MNRLVAIFPLLCSALLCLAEPVQFSASVEMPTVAVGTPFALTYTLNAAGTNLRLPPMPDAVKLLTPTPSTDVEQFSSTINGRKQTATAYRYTYTLQAKRQGSFTIPAASITAGGKRYTSNAVAVKVVAAGTQKPAANDYEDVFIRVIPSKTTVYEQEAVLLTYKLYAAESNFTKFERVKFPDSKGFVVQDMELPANVRWQTETSNRKEYGTVPVKQQILQPQQSGALEVGQGSFDAVLRVPGFAGAVSKTLTTSPVKITIKPLPAGHPASFAGAVGEFSLASELSPSPLQTNEALTLTLRFSGTGNLNLLKNPAVQFPAGFETYEPEVETDLRATAEGVSGTRTIRYLAIPRTEGAFTIPPVTFGYFNPETVTYAELTTPAYHVTVEQGESTVVALPTVSKPAERRLPADIRPLKTGSAEPLGERLPFFGSAGFWSAYGVLMLLAVGLFFFFRKRAQADPAETKRRKAGERALARLKAARGSEGKAFFDELLKTLEACLSDRFDLPPAELSKENIEAQLRSHGADETVIARLIRLMETCETARYAPSGFVAEPESVYEQAVEVINEMVGHTSASLHNQIRNDERTNSGISRLVTRSMTRNPLVLLFFCLLSVFPLRGATGSPNADSLYLAGHYAEAAQAYEMLLETQGETPEWRYNFGNACYRQSQWAKAILNYERCLALRPADQDARANLQLAQAKTPDNLTTTDSFFVAFWNDRVSALFDGDTWAWLSIVALALALAGAFVYFLTERSAWRQAMFFAVIGLIFISVAAFFIAKGQADLLLDSREAIVMPAAVSVKSSPAVSGTELFLLHEGAKVEIRSTLGDWTEIRLPDGRIGWVPAEAVEKICSKKNH